MNPGPRLLGQLGSVRIYSAATPDEAASATKEPQYPPVRPRPPALAQPKGPPSYSPQPSPSATAPHQTTAIQQYIQPGYGRASLYNYNWSSQSTTEDRTGASLSPQKPKGEPARRSQALINRASEIVSKSNIKKLQQKAHHTRYDPPDTQDDRDEDLYTEPESKPSRPQSSSSNALTQAPSSNSLGHQDRNAVETPRQSQKQKYAVALGQSRSACFALEMSIQERLRDAGARSHGPCPIRLQVYREALDEITEKYSMYGHLLKQIKTEYEAAGVPMQDGGLHIMYNDLVLLHSQLKHDYDQLLVLHREEMQRTRKLMGDNETIKKRIEAKNAELEQLKQRALSYDPNWQQQQRIKSKIESIERDDTFESSTNPNGFTQNTMDARAVWGHNQILEKKLMNMTHEYTQAQQKERETSYRINHIAEDLASDILRD